MRNQSKLICIGNFAIKIWYTTTVECYVCASVKKKILLYLFKLHFQPVHKLSKFQAYQTSAKFPGREFSYCNNLHSNSRVSERNAFNFKCEYFLVVNYYIESLAFVILLIIRVFLIGVDVNTGYLNLGTCLWQNEYSKSILLTKQL